MTLSHYHQQLRAMQGGMPALSDSGALKHHTARVKRLVAIDAKDHARGIVEIITAECLAGWQPALDRLACTAWLTEHATLTDGAGRAYTDEALAVQWVEFLRLIERAP